MKNLFGITALALGIGATFAATSAMATVTTITWQLNPTNANAAVGSSSQTFTSQGYQITARGFDNNNGFGTAHELFFKSQGPIGGAGEHGLGLTNISDNELNLTAQSAVANFIQLDLTSILMQGFVNGRVEVGSVQAGESFQLYGSNTAGTLGVALGAPLGSAFDDKFVPVSDFGAFKFISIASASVDVLPVAFQADITPVPEMSTFFPIIGLVAAVGSTHLLRRRRVARSAAEVA